VFASDVVVIDGRLKNPAIADVVKRVTFYWEMDRHNQTALLFPCGSCIAFSCSSGIRLHEWELATDGFFAGSNVGAVVGFQFSWR
jgi:hypothetical protein